MSLQLRPDTPRRVLLICDGCPSLCFSSKGPSLSLSISLSLALLLLKTCYQPLTSPASLQTTAHRRVFILSSRLLGCRWIPSKKKKVKERKRKRDQDAKSPFDVYPRFLQVKRQKKREESQPCCQATSTRARARGLCEYSHGLHTAAQTDAYKCPSWIRGG